MRISCLIFSLLLSVGAFADTISVTVTGVIERASTLVPEIPVDSSFSVTFSYSDTLPDLNPGVGIGEYVVSGPGLGIAGHINDFVLQNRDPVNLEIQLPRPFATTQFPVVNVTVPRFGNNLFITNPPAGLSSLPVHMNWALSVPLGSAFFPNEAPPTAWPSVSDLKQTSGIPSTSIAWQLSIDGVLDNITGTVQTISPGAPAPVPVPGAILLLLVPAILLRSFDQRNQKLPVQLVT